MVELGDPGPHPENLGPTIRVGFILILGLWVFGLPQFRLMDLVFMF